MEKRITWIDSAKGIGILLIILGHTNPPFKNYIFWFHVPLFFILSGITLKTSSNYKNFVFKKINRLIKPYFLYGITVILLTFFSIFLYMGQLKMGQLKLLVWLIYGGEKAQGIIGAYWFLPILFFSVISINYMLENYSEWLCWTIIIVEYIISFIIINFVKMTFYLPLDVLTFPLGSFFVMVGYKYGDFNKYVFNKYIKESYQIVFLCLVSLLIFLLFPKFNFDMKYLVLNNFVLDLVIPLVISFTIIKICKLIWTSKQPGFFSKVGKMSLDLMLLHNFFINLTETYTNNWLILFIVSTILACISSIILSKLKHELKKATYN